MKNIDGEEIDEKLFNKESSKKLNEINQALEDGADDNTPVAFVLKLVLEYGMIMYTYGAFMHKAAESQINSKKE